MARQLLLLQWVRQPAAVQALLDEAARSNAVDPVGSSFAEPSGRETVMFAIPAGYGPKVQPQGWVQLPAAAAASAGSGAAAVPLRVAASGSSVTLPTLASTVGSVSALCPA